MKQRHKVPGNGLSDSHTMSQSQLKVDKAREKSRAFQVHAAC